MTFRTKSIMVSPAVYDALKTLADIEGHDCPDAVADLRLGLMLSKDADLMWAIEERKKRLKQFKSDYSDRLRAKVTDDEIP